FQLDRERAWASFAYRSMEPGCDVGTHRKDQMVSVSTAPEMLLPDARTALRRRVSDELRTELSSAFLAWLLPSSNADFASLVSAAATREGALQDFQTVAI